MSLAEAVGWTLLRSLTVAAFAVAAASRFRRLIDTTKEPKRTVLWVALLLTYFTPVLLVGYAYSSFSLSLVHFPAANELLYSLLLLMRFVAVAVVVLRFAPPPPVSAEALHAARLSLPSVGGPYHRLAAWLGYWIRGPVRSLIPAFAVVFLLVFQEFEMASRMRVTAGTFHTPASWTVWLFDAHVRGLILEDSLRLALLPLGIDAAVVALAAFAVLRGNRWRSAGSRPARSVSRAERIGLWTGLAIAGLAVLVVPSAIVLRGTPEGLGVFLKSPQFHKSIITSLLLAFICGTVATFAGALIFSNDPVRRLRRARIAVGIVASLPGLAGSLILALATLAWFQLRTFGFLYDTPAAFVAAMILFLLPRAMLLQLLMNAPENQESSHLGTLLRASPSADQRAAGRELLWTTRLRGRVWVWGFVCYWAYWDLTLADLLLPPGMAPAPARLYNLMHYGQNAVQSAMLLFTIAIPVLIILFLACIRRPLLRCLIR